MPFFDYVTCAPLRIFARLEPRARRVDFDEALQARVHDPLWMLGRQWRGDARQQNPTANHFQQQHRRFRSGPAETLTASPLRRI